MRIAREAAKTMQLVHLDPKQCKPMESAHGQPRHEFDNIAELTESIRQAGQWTPGVVRLSKDKKNEILSGERRWRAVGNIKGQKYLAVRVKVKDERAIPFILACITNGNNSPLKALEMCEAIEKLYDDEEIPMRFIAEEIFGISINKAHAYHRLMYLHPDVKQMLAEGKITESDAFGLSSEPYREQPEKAQRLVAGKAMRALGDPIPLIERRNSRQRKKATTPAEPIERLLVFSSRLKASTTRFEALLKEEGLSKVLKGKFRKHRTVLDEVRSAQRALQKCVEFLKKTPLK